jgi:hypothetical protein
MFNAAVQSATATTVTFASGPNNTTEAEPNTYFAKIVKGKGIGQSRRITANAGTGTITLEKAWNVIPDTTSIVATGRQVEKVVVYNNEFNANNKAYITGTTYTANTGINAYGNCNNFVIDNNLYSKLRTGVTITGFQQTSTTSDCNHWILVMNNTIDFCRWGIKTIEERVDSTWNIPYTQVLGVIYRNNIITNSVVAHATYTIKTAVQAVPNVDLVVWEHNTMPTSTILNDITGSAPAAGTLDHVVMYDNSAP